MKFTFRVEFRVIRAVDISAHIRHPNVVTSSAQLEAEHISCAFIMRAITLRIFIHQIVK